MLEIPRGATWPTQLWRDGRGTIKQKGTLAMEEHLYPNVSKDLAQKRRELAPEIYGAFRTFGERVFADGALPSKTKQLIAVAVAHVTQCPYCIRGHTELALKKGATEQELMEAIWIAAEMRAGAAYAHSILAIDAMHRPEPTPGA